MGFQIVIAGVVVCDMFNQACLVADYLAQVLPNFCYQRVEKSLLEWDAWLKQINQKNNWHHLDSPLIWKELLMKGSKPYYIGYAHDFWEYCHSYYKLDAFLPQDKFDNLLENFTQFLKVNIQNETNVNSSSVLPKEVHENSFDVCISGARFPLTMHLISGLMEMTKGENNISKVFIHDNLCDSNFMEYVETECSFIGSDYPNKTVKNVSKLGIALTQSDLLIILDHIPFNEELPIGTWLDLNRSLMQNLAHIINATASAKMKILFPNLGPACFNATVLSRELINIKPANIAVATSDLGLEISPIIAEIAEVPMKNMFCPPVWGFVGINHIIDAKNTIHLYNSFAPYKRYVKIKNSTLKIGSLTPEIRSMDYLLHYDETLWERVVRKKEIIDKCEKFNLTLNKVESLLSIVKLWLFESDHNFIANVGITCDGTFGLNFDGYFSQPARLINGVWLPAKEFPTPNEYQVKLPYLISIAELMMTLPKGALPKLIPCFPCYCNPRFYVKKENKKFLTQPANVSNVKINS